MEDNVVKNQEEEEAVEELEDDGSWGWDSSCRIAHHGRPFTYYPGVDAKARQHLVALNYMSLENGSTEALSSLMNAVEMLLTFLDLPLSVRHRIYALAGLVRPCPIDLVEEGRRISRMMQLPARWFETNLEDYCFYPSWRTGCRERFSDGDLQCFCPALPVLLLCVSRSIRREVEDILYSQNRFKLLPPKTEASEEKFDLEPFLRLSSEALAALRYLHVKLGPCHTELSRLCKVLSAQSTLSQLSFSVYLRFPSGSLPGVLGPLEDLAGLKECAISLRCPTEEEARAPGWGSGEAQRIYHQNRLSLRLELSKELRQLAKSTALRLTRRTAIPSKPFPFTRLPAEIQARILFFTYVEPTYSNIDPSRTGIEIRNRRISPPRGCCNTCTPTLSICACWRCKVAYSTTCSCYSTPLSLFYVSRLLNTEATYSFFSHNRFMVGHESFQETLEFFRSLNPLALRSIRRLDLKVVDRQFRNWYDSRSMEPEHCQALVEFIAENFNLPRLHLSIVSSILTGPDDFKWVREVQWVLVKYMRRLRGLKGFHVYQSIFLEDEPEMERSVMGEGYDAMEDGKLVRRPRNGAFQPPLLIYL